VRTSINMEKENKEELNEEKLSAVSDDLSRSSVVDKNETQDEFTTLASNNNAKSRGSSLGSGARKVHKKNHRDRVRKGARGASMASAVTKSLIRSAAEVAGGRDAYKELQTIDHEVVDTILPEGHDIYVSARCLDDGVGCKGLTLTYLPGMSGIEILGTLNTEWGEIGLAGVYQFYDGVTRPSRVYKSGLLILSASNGAPVKPKYTTDSRVQRSCLSVLQRLDYSKGLNHLIISSNIKTHYKRFHDDYSELDKDIQDLINSVWFEANHEMFLDNALELWEHRMTNRLKTYYCSVGEDLDYLVEDQQMGFFNSIRKVLVRAKASIYANLFRESYRKRVLDSYAVTSKRQALKNISTLIPKEKVAMVPCARLGIYKSVVESGRIPEIVSPGMEVESNYDEYSGTGTENMVESYGVGIQGPVAVPDTHTQNLHAAVNIRMGQWNGHTNTAFEEYAMKLIDQMPDVHLESGGQLEYLQTQYGKAKGLRLFKAGQQEVTRKDKTRKLFAKKEAYVGKTSGNMKPRMICAPSDVLLGKYAHAFGQVGKSLSKLFNGGKVLYTSGSTPDLVGQYASSLFSTSEYVYEGDASNFDGNYSPSMLKVEEYYLNTKVHGWPDSFKSEMRHGIASLSSYKGDLRVTLEHARLSGDLNTSCMNSLGNLLSFMWVFGLDWNSDFRFMMQGDDNAFCVPVEPDIDRVLAAYSSIGMDMNLIARSHIGELEFCSGFFLPVGGTYRYSMGFKCLSKLGLNHNNHAAHLLPGLLYGTAKSLLPLVGHVPLVGEIFRQIVEQSVAKNIRARTERSWQGRIGGGVALKPDMETYTAFADRYDLSVDLILSLEDSVRRDFRVENCPILITDQIYIDCLKKEVSPKEWEDSYTHTPKVDEHHMITVEIPRYEEAAKLDGARSFLHAMRRARAWGRQEDHEFGTTNHELLHQLFTSVSYINFEAGVALHQAYNRRALETGIQVAAKGKKTVPKPPQPPVTRKAGKLDRYIVANSSPFHPAAEGAKIPDDIAMPGVAASFKLDVDRSIDANGFLVFGVRADPLNSLMDPASITAGGAITWATANAVTVTSASNFPSSSEYRLYRLVGAGMRLSYISAGDVAAGKIIIGMGPETLHSTYEFGWPEFPDTVALFNALPEQVELTVADLVKAPITVPFRRFGPRSREYILNGRGKLNSIYSEMGVDATTGWSNIFVMVSGGTADAVIEVEMVYHVELMYNGGAGGFIRPTPPAPHRPEVMQAVQKLQSTLRADRGMNFHGHLKQAVKEVLGKGAEVGKDLLISGGGALLTKTLPYLEALLL